MEGRYAAPPGDFATSHGSIPSQIFSEISEKKMPTFARVQEALAIAQHDWTCVSARLQIKSAVHSFVNSDHAKTISVEQKTDALIAVTLNLDSQLHVESAISRLEMSECAPLPPISPLFDEIARVKRNVEREYLLCPFNDSTWSSLSNALSTKSTTTKHVRKLLLRVTDAALRNDALVLLQRQVSNQSLLDFLATSKGRDIFGEMERWQMTDDTTLKLLLFLQQHCRNFETLSVLLLASRAFVCQCPS